MIRRPLRPLARIIAARDKGEDPDLQAAQARLAAARKKRSKEFWRARLRIVLVGLLFMGAFTTIGGRMALMATGSDNGQNQRVAATKVSSERADIFDRHGRLLATNVSTPSLYAQTDQVLDPIGTATALAQIFPDLDAVKWARKLDQKGKFMWIKRRISPEQAQAAFDIGDPGIKLGKREVRVYPNGNLGAHVLGGAGFGTEEVNAAQVVGRAGVERWFDRHLRGSETTAPQPLVLSLDATIQYGVRKVLESGMKLMNAKGGSAVLMHAKTGEIISLVSLPDYDPNYLPHAPKTGDPGNSLLFNRASQGVYELGSTYKLFTAASAIEAGIATPDTLIDTKPMTWGRFNIREYGGTSLAPYQSLTNVLVRSSNIGSARLAMEFGTDAQKTLLSELGLLEPTPLELPSAKVTKPLFPRRWSEISTITISYGHGLSASPLHLAAAYASLTNGGIRVKPTLVKDGYKEQTSFRVISSATSASLRYILRKVVTEGTAGMADVPGYDVGAKTGTAEKPDPQGGYYKDKVIANIATVFPISDPEYVLVVTLDEPEDTVRGKPKRSAGWTVAPIAGEIIRRIGPLLGAQVASPGLNQGESPLHLALQ